MSAEAGRTLQHTSDSVGHPGLKPASVSLPLARARRSPTGQHLPPQKEYVREKSAKSRWRTGTAGEEQERAGLRLAAGHRAPPAQHSCWTRSLAQAGS